MKKTSTLLFFLILFTSLQSQNLVRNPSFETYTSCPSISTLPLINNWDMPWQNFVGGDTCSTSDGYDPVGCFGGLVLGAANAHTGNTFAGFITFEGAFGNCSSPGIASGWREYVEGELTSPLAAGQDYCVSFWTNRASGVWWETDKMGVALTNSKIYEPCTGNSASDLQSRGHFADWEDPNFLTVGGSSWEQSFFTYNASGGEDFITIGNFHPNASTNWQCGPDSAGGFNFYAYYYIDDVSVTPGACFLPTEVISFTSKCEDTYLTLEWATISEQDAQQFIVERSYDGKKWKEIGRQNGAGTSYSKNYYSVQDENPSYNNAYYRLRQVDHNSGVRTLNTILGACDKERNEISAWSLPGSNQLQFSYSGKESSVQLFVTDAVGKTLLKRQFSASGGGMSSSVNMNNVSNGVYYAIFYAGDDKIIKKIVVTEGHMLVGD